MALRYLARKVGIPALRRASGPRVSPPAGGRSLNSSASQGGHNNGSAVDGARKSGKGSAEDVYEHITRLQAEFDANMQAVRDEKVGGRMMMGSCVAGLGFAIFLTR